MGKLHEANLTFNNDFKGKGQSKSGIMLHVGTNGFAPYELLFLSLGSCLYSTFFDIAKKMRIRWESVKMNLCGEKRDEVPTTLKWCKIEVKVLNASDTTKTLKAFELATKYCSIYYTVSKVAEITWTMDFL
ncbi:OsmC family protein [Kosmotoga pacifica]|uniref:OsmC family protein n=1 Tax=Kosmotoga pacifica TaxID=1330330 RepID=UPI00069B0932|nr:OsmC family protein [Kosmotoga pacifica]